jgi:hypothetical protein
LRAPRRCLRSWLRFPTSIGQTRTSRVTTWIVRTTQVHLSFRTHILAAIRLFTCQRALYSYADFSSKFGDKFTANVGGNFRYRRRVPRLGEADISVSFACVNWRRRRFSHLHHPAVLPARCHLMGRREIPNRLTGSGPSMLSINFWCCLSQRSTVTFECRG